MRNLCELIEDVDCDEIARKLKVTEICPKSIPEKYSITMMSISTSSEFFCHSVIPDEKYEKFCGCDVDSGNFRSQRYKRPQPTWRTYYVLGYFTRFFLTKIDLCCLDFNHLMKPISSANILVLKKNTKSAKLYFLTISCAGLPTFANTSAG